MKNDNELFVKSKRTEPRRLRIGIFVDLYLPHVDGVAVVVHNLATCLSETADVTVFAPEVKGMGVMPETNYKIVRSKVIKVPFIGYDFAIPNSDSNFCYTLHTSQFDLIHIHSPFSMGKIGMRFARKHNIPVVGTMHSQFKMDFKTRTKSELLTKIMLHKIISIFNKCDECWAVSEKMAEVFIDYGVKKPILVHRNGTDMLPVGPVAKLNELKKKHNIVDGEHVLLFVGRISYLKNVFFILEALKILHEQNYPFKMLFIGSGPEEKNLSKWAGIYHLDDCVEMVGSILDRDLLAEYYRMADLFLFPSLYDASSLVQIEAASQHTPTLFLKGAVTANSVYDNVNGYLSEGTSEAYATKIVSIFADEKRYKQVSNGAYKNLYRLWNEEVKDMSQDYQRLIESKILSSKFKNKKTFATVTKSIN